MELGAPGMLRRIAINMAPNSLSNITLAANKSIPTTPQLRASTPITSSAGSSSEMPVSQHSTCLSAPRFTWVLASIGDPVDKRCQQRLEVYLSDKRCED
jgi:hypothetical protein